MDIEKELNLDEPELKVNSKLFPRDSPKDFENNLCTIHSCNQ